MGSTSRWIALWAFVGLILFSAREAHATSFQVAPVKLALSASATSGIISVHNESQEMIRVQVSAQAWSESPDGKMQLAPTEDLIVFPALLSIGPGDKKNVRVATSTGFEATEKTYRVFVEELQGMQQAPVANGVRVLTRMGVPIFMEPTAKGTGVPKLDNAALGGGKIRFTLRNGGTVHFVTQQLTIVGFAADGGQLFETKASGWYVLPGGHRDFVVDGAANMCSSARVVIMADTDAGKVSLELTGPNAACH